MYHNPLTVFTALALLSVYVCKVLFGCPKYIVTPVELTAAATKYQVFVENFNPVAALYSLEASSQENARGLPVAPPINIPLLPPPCLLTAIASYDAIFLLLNHAIIVKLLVFGTAVDIVAVEKSPLLAPLNWRPPPWYPPVAFMNALPLIVPFCDSVE